MTRRTLTLGLGLTNECNLACAFCYRDPSRTDRLTAAQVRHILDSLPLRSINLGTGENGMHPEFSEIVDDLQKRTAKLTITSNGHSVALMSDDQVRAFHDIEFSIDYPTREEQDRQRGSGNWDLIMAQAERCRQLGVPVSFIAVMMRSNFDRLAEVAAIAATFEAPLRVNVYQSVRSDAFALTYEEYWSGFRRLFAQTAAIWIGEPLVRAAAGWPAPDPDEPRCGAGTVRITPRGTVQPCVYWPDATPLAAAPGDDFEALPAFVLARSVPEACQPCAWRETCRGGCAGRRRLQDALDRPDPYCPVLRGDLPALQVQRALPRDLPKTGSACTTVVIAIQGTGPQGIRHV